MKYLAGCCCLLSHSLLEHKEKSRHTSICVRVVREVKERGKMKIQRSPCEEYQCCDY